MNSIEVITSLAKSIVGLQTARAVIDENIISMSKLAGEVATLRGQMWVMLELLRDAADALHAVSGDSPEEEQKLNSLRERIKDACAAMMLQALSEAKGATREL